ncbi:MAG: hypothetical protein LBP79_04750 [Clostridiales bacterium]|jgi:hypothetical protein|nr:hypothetical protein [Clostridiales bacterium]
MFFDLYRDKLLSVRVSRALLSDKFARFSSFVALQGYAGKCSFGDFFEFLLQNSDKLFELNKAGVLDGNEKSF